MYVVKVPGFFWRMFPGIIWRLPGKGRKIYLTFDDGPTPDVTDFVLDTLAEFNAKATFFCLGKNVKAHPALYKRILMEGHTTGNHSYSHLNGWETADEIYYDDIAECALKVKSDLFRPPYGKISLNQMQHLKKNYHIVMWDVLSGDFDPEISVKKCLSNILQNTHEGSIVVLHDNVKAEPVLKKVLPQVLKYFSDGGYSFSAIRV